LQIGDFLQEQVRVSQIDGAVLKLAQELYVLQIRRTDFQFCDYLEDPTLFFCLTVHTENPIRFLDDCTYKISP
jgi:hypothetical protein